MDGRLRMKELHSLDLSKAVCLWNGEYENAIVLCGVRLTTGRVDGLVVS